MGTDPSEKWEESSLQRPGAEHFVLPKRFERGCGNGRHGKCTSKSSKDFDRVAFGPIRRHVMLNDLDNIPSTEPMLRQVTSQRHIGIEIKSHFALRLSGISVINFVFPTSVPSSKAFEPTE